MSGSIRPVAVFGIGGHGREIAELLEACRADGQAVTPAGFLVDRQFAEGRSSVGDLAVLGDAEWLARRVHQVEVIVGIGAPELRLRVARRLAALGARFATAVHPDATVARRVAIGVGSIVMAGARVTCDIEIGAHVHIGQNSTIGHDSKLADYVSVYPGAIVSGGVCAHEGVLLGAGSIVTERVEVGAWTRVGAGCAVLRSTEANQTLVGVPATVVRQRPSGWQLSGSGE